MRMSESDKGAKKRHPHTHIYTMVGDMRADTLWIRQTNNSAITLNLVDLFLSVRFVVNRKYKSNLLFLLTAHTICTHKRTHAHDYPFCFDKCRSFVQWPHLDNFIWKVTQNFWTIFNEKVELASLRYTWIIRQMSHPISYCACVHTAFTDDGERRIDHGERNHYDMTLS